MIAFWRCLLQLCLLHTLFRLRHSSRLWDLPGWMGHCPGTLSTNVSRVEKCGHLVIAEIISFSASVTPPLGCWNSPSGVVSSRVNCVVAVGILFFGGRVFKLPINSRCSFTFFFNSTNVMPYHSGPLDPSTIPTTICFNDSSLISMRIWNARRFGSMMFKLRLLCHRYSSMLWNLMNMFSRLSPLFGLKFL